MHYAVKALAKYSLLTLILASCSGNPVMSPIPDELRTLSTEFDGKWTGMVSMTQKSQSHGRYEYTCPVMESALSFKVKKGKASGKITDPEGGIVVFTSYVKNDGNFLGMTETSKKYSGNMTGDNKINFVIQMQLTPKQKQSKGEFVLSFGKKGQGCTASVTAKRKG